MGWKAKPQQPGETDEQYQKRLRHNEIGRKSYDKNKEKYKEKYEEKKAAKEAKKAAEEAKKERQRERKRINQRNYFERLKGKTKEEANMSSSSSSSSSQLETQFQQLVANALQNPGNLTPEQVSVIDSISKVTAARHGANAAKMMKDVVSIAAKLEPHQSSVIQEALRSGNLSMLTDMAGTAKYDGNTTATAAATATTRAREELEEN